MNRNPKRWNIQLLFLLAATLLSNVVQLPAQGPEPILIEDVTLIDGTGRRPIPGAYILIQNGRVEQISRQAITAPAGARQINGQGKYLIPGLMDVHIHLRGVPDGNLYVGGDEGPSEEIGIQVLHTYLYSGVTSLYDAGNNPDFIMGLRSRERNGEIESPRIFATGGIVTYPGSHGSFAGATLVDDWPEAISQLDKHLERAPDMVKLTYEERGWGSRPMIPLLPLDLMEKIVQYYNDHGVRATVHAAGEYRVRQAIFAGIDALAHPIIVGPITDDFARLMGAKKVPMASTLTIGENYSRLVDHPEFLDQPLYRATLDPAEIERLKTEERDRQAKRTWTTWMKVMTPIAQENLRKIHEAGGIVALGTDQSLGPAVHREMELLVGAGIPPLDVIRIATLNSALYLGKEKDLGSIEEGKVADLVLLEADPTADINNAKKIELVVKGGKMIDRAALDLPINRR